MHDNVEMVQLSLSEITINVIVSVVARLVLNITLSEEHSFKFYNLQTLNLSKVGVATTVVVRSSQPGNFPDRR